MSDDAAPETAFKVVSVGERALDDEGREMSTVGDAPKQGSPAAAIGVRCVLLLPVERSLAERLQPVIADTVKRLAKAGRVALIGVAPAYPMAVRMLPGGVAQKNREDDVTALLKRCEAAKAAAGAPDVPVHVLGHGTDSSDHLVLAACTAACRDIARSSGASRGVMLSLSIAPDGSGGLVRTHTESIMRHILAARRGAEGGKASSDDANCLSSATSVCVLREPSTERRKHAPSAAVTRRAAAGTRMLVCLVEADAYTGPTLPNHVRCAIDEASDGDEVVLFVPVRLPGAGEAAQLNHTDWHDRLKDGDKATELVLADMKRAAATHCARRGKRVALGTATSVKHHTQAVEDLMSAYEPSAVVVEPGFRRHTVMRGVIEFVQGAEYERVMKATRSADFVVA